MTVVATFEVGYSQFIGPAGQAAKPLPDHFGDLAVLATLYRAMVRTRGFDAKAIALQRTGRLGTYASSLGQEAVAVGVATAMRPEDIFLPSFREHGAQLWRGARPEEILLYWGGDERGNSFAAAPHDFPNCVPVGSHAPHAVGIALALKLRREPRVAVCVFGDGATSKGDVAEALNIAGVWRLPAVFVVANNAWAISVPRARQSAAQTLAQKSVAAGIPGEHVDGNDVVAVAAAVGEAIERARAGGGPSLVEAVTYRLGDHTTADDAGRYRDDSEVTRHWPEEPLLRLRHFLTERGAWTKDDEEKLLQECAAEMDAAADRYLATPPQDPDTIFDFTFARSPADIEAQRSEPPRFAERAR